jgi:hypothetical protein
MDQQNDPSLISERTVPSELRGTMDALSSREIKRHVYADIAVFCFFKMNDAFYLLNLVHALDTGRTLRTTSR